MPSEVFMSIIIINFNDRFKRCFRVNGFISTLENKILQQGYSMRITESPILDSLDHSAHKISGWHKFKISESLSCLTDNIFSYTQITSVEVNFHMQPCNIEDEYPNSLYFHLKEP